ncbi:unnamed protein product [Rhizoctonia solani]|uniref:Histone deacetylase domain-containing protein n=1 Tax=Rhizoctonia solani TaxID=456999 RepID=A0A8H2W8E0_9AGAM|nr:unnamed protein product [Rhizoctonia solani]
MDRPEPKLSIHVQPSCSEHRYIRDKDLSTIVERPERLRALAIGIAAGIAINEANLPGLSTPGDTVASQDDLAATMEKLSLQSNEDIVLSTPVAKIVRYARPADASFLNNPAVRMIHALEEDKESGSGEEYISQLSRWALESEDRIKAGGSEIPKGEGLSQGDLYHSVIDSTSPLSFAAIRPPGHHCGSDEPAGFCWVNNILVGAAHGNGTQSVTWKLNAETHRKQLEAGARHAAGIPDHPEGLQIYYGSLHDVLSYPCEDGDPTLTAAASISLHGNAHGQHIENVHLQEWKDEDDFFNRLYGDPLQNEGGGCGFDAGEHEYESMSRHNRRVPTTFYHRFACDAREFAQLYAKGRVVGVLEGGYSDRALVSGGMAWVNGMIGVSREKARDLWSIANLEKIELATGLKKVRKPRSSTSKSSAPSHEPWIDRTLHLLPTLDATLGAIHTPAPRTRKKAEPPPSTRTLRDRSSKAQPESRVGKPVSTKDKYALASDTKNSRAGSTGKASRPGSPEDILVPPVPPVPTPQSVSAKTSPDLIPTIMPPVTGEVIHVGEEIDDAVKAFESISLDPSEVENRGPDSTVSVPSQAPLVIKLKRPPPSAGS